MEPEKNVAVGRYWAKFKKCHPPTGTSRLVSATMAEKRHRGQEATARVTTHKTQPSRGAAALPDCDSSCNAADSLLGLLPPGARQGTRALHRCRPRAWSGRQGRPVRLGSLREQRAGHGRQPPSSRARGHADTARPLLPHVLPFRSPSGRERGQGQGRLLRRFRSGFTAEADVVSTPRRGLQAP